MLLINETIETIETFEIEPKIFSEADENLQEEVNDEEEAEMMDEEEEEAEMMDEDEEVENQSEN